MKPGTGRELVVWQLWASLPTLLSLSKIENLRLDLSRMKDPCLATGNDGTLHSQYYPEDKSKLLLNQHLALYNLQLSGACLYFLWKLPASRSCLGHWILPCLFLAACLPLNLAASLPGTKLDTLSWCKPGGFSLGKILEGRWKRAFEQWNVSGRFWASLANTNFKKYWGRSKNERRIVGLG